MNIKLLHKKLIQKKLTISVAESCTGGLLAKNLTKLSNAYKYCQIGLITYSNNAKIKTIGLDYIKVKKSNKLLITKNIIKQKSRKAIQNATVKRTLEIVGSLI